MKKNLLKKNRFVKGALASVMAAAMLTTAVGCAGTSEAEDASEGKGEAPAAVQRDTFTYAMSDDPGNVLNYFTSDDRVSMTVIKALNEPLFTINADGTYNYYAAESLDISDDGLTYTVDLKDDIKWSDGEPIDADDVVFSYDAYMAQDESGLLQVGGENIEVTKVDDGTVEFELPSPVASMPENLSNVNLIPEHVFEDADSLDMNMLEDEIVGNGPYKFDEYRAGEYIKMVKNPEYMNGEAAIDNYVVRIIPNAETAKAALQKGEVDAWVATASQLDGLEDMNVTPYSEGRVAYVRLNRVADSMQDPSYREGVLKALNKEEIMVAAYSSLDFATLSDSFLPATNGYYTDDLEKYEQNLDEARELVAGGATSLSLCYNSTDPAQSAEAQVMQAQLAQIGIDLELVGLDQAGYMASAYDNEDTTYDMYLGGYVMTIDPDGYKGMFGTGQMINYANDELDELFNRGMVETDPEARAEIYKEAQRVVADEALFYPFGTNLRLLVTNPELQGLEDAGFAPIYTFEDVSKLRY